MIYVMQGGRCGNQLFVYAFARSLQMKYSNEKICFDFSGLKWGQEKYKNGLYWEDSLSRFNVVEYQTVCDGRDLIKKHGSFSQKIVYFVWRVVNRMVKDKTTPRAEKIRRKLFYWSSKYGLYYIQFGYGEYQISRYKNKFAWGSFEDPKWFDDIRDILINEYTPKEALKEENKDLLDIIHNSNSVCVSLRKWALDIHEEDNLKNRDLCDLAYYTKAIDKIKQKVSNPVFIVFSDDVEWATKLIESISGNMKVYSESGNDDVAEKIRLMSSCKHFIISNSTFGWWPQYLCTYKEKIVISPDCWLETFSNKHPLIMKEWDLIPVKKGNR